MVRHPGQEFGRRLLLLLVDQLHHAVPHDGAALVHIAVGVADDFGVGAQLEAVEHDARCLPHGVLHPRHVRVQTVERRADQHRVMDRRADLDALLGREAAGQPQHFGAVGLHREIRAGSGCSLSGGTCTRQPNTVCRLPVSIA